MERMRRGASEVEGMAKLKLRKAGNNEKERLSQEVHSNITQKLLQKEQQISQIERMMKDIKLSTIQEEALPYTGLGYERHEAMVRDFVQMEEQVTDFDREINEILALQNRPSSSTICDSSHDEISKILERIKSHQSMSQGSTRGNKIETQNRVNESQAEEDQRINALLMDIEKEFQDLDDILREADEVVQIKP